MRKFMLAGLVVALLIAVGTPAAMAGDGNQFMKQNGFMNMIKNAFTWMYQWSRDDDNDGIPNGQDDDWEAPQDGFGYRMEYRNNYLWEKAAENGLLTRLRDRYRDGSCME